jgi:quinohemoprotein ethanol dehydrogenase
MRHYAANCAVCHGPAGMSSGVLPDLRRSGALSDAGTWKDIVHDGQFTARGMVGFSKWLTEADVEAVRAYVGDAARKLQKEESGR